MKHPLIPLSLRQPVQKPLANLVSKAIPTSVSLFSWASQNRDKKILRIRGHYHITLNKVLIRRTSVMLEPEDIPNQFYHSKFLP